MSKLVWDATGSRYYETGTKNGVLYPMSSNGTYGTGVAWNGLTGVTESPEGAELTDLWADDIKYASMRSAENFKYTIEAYTYPDEFMECDGSAAPTGTLGTYFGQQSRKSFGFVYTTQVGNDSKAAGNEDGYYKIHIVYNSTASPSEKGYATINDSPEAITFSWECSATPETVTGSTTLKPVATIVIDSRTANAACLTALENILYGTDGTNGTTARLPGPAEVITTMTPAT